MNLCCVDVKFDLKCSVTQLINLFRCCGGRFMSLALVAKRQLRECLETVSLVGKARFLTPRCRVNS